MRYHQKTDGILMIAEDGRARFLTLVERLLFAIGINPSYRASDGRAA